MAFEVGLSIGQKKRCLLFRNSSLEADKALANAVGLFDTLGYQEYTNSEQLSRLLVAQSNYEPIPFHHSINHKAPVYIVEPPHRTDAIGLLISRIKKARWMYRSFNPGEDVRLAAMDAISNVAQSSGVIAPLLGENAADRLENNIRALFVAGISIALDIPTLIIHPHNLTAPIDVRDLAKKWRHPDDIKEIVQEFSLEINEFSQRDFPTIQDPKGLLGTLHVGDPTAENEMTTLSDYYLATDEYQRALRGEVNLVVGRKGSGKTALFVQVRNAKRSNKQNVVVDLKPEGYQLIKLKERVLDRVTEGARQHLITAFWEYLLLLEITYKVLEKDKTYHLHNHTLTEKYFVLRETYGDEKLTTRGDFSERLVELSDRLTNDYASRFPDSQDLNLNADQVTELLHRHDMRKLLDQLCDYLLNKEEVWVLFDNIDKGWNVDGVTETDIFVLRCLTV